MGSLWLVLVALFVQQGCALKIPSIWDAVTGFIQLDSAIQLSAEGADTDAVQRQLDVSGTVLQLEQVTRATDATVAEALKAKVVQFKAYNRAGKTDKTAATLEKGRALESIRDAFLMEAEPVGSMSQLEVANRMWHAWSNAIKWNTGYVLSRWQVDEHAQTVAAKYAAGKVLQEADEDADAFNKALTAQAQRRALRTMADKAARTVALKSVMNIQVSTQASRLPPDTDDLTHAADTAVSAMLEAKLRRCEVMQNALKLDSLVTARHDLYERAYDASNSTTAADAQSLRSTAAAKIGEAFDSELTVAPPQVKMSRYDNALSALQDSRQAKDEVLSIARSENENLRDQLMTANDINECATNNGGCAHACVNTLGWSWNGPSYHCECEGNYTLAEDGMNCEPGGCLIKGLRYPGNGTLARFSKCKEGKTVPHGTVCEMVCNGGYVQTGTSPKCSLGVMSDHDVECTGHGCVLDFMPKPKYGTINPGCSSGTRFKDGQQCKLSCKKGFTMHGKQPTCKQGVVINKNSIQCAGKSCLIQPNDYALPDKGVRDQRCLIGSTLRDGHSCNHTCASGYFLLGEQPSCSKGTMDAGTLECEPRGCIMPFVVIPNGDVEVDCTNGRTVRNGYSCDVICEEGYAHNGIKPNCRAGDVTNTNGMITCSPITDCGVANTEGMPKCKCKEGFTGNLKWNRVDNSYYGVCVPDSLDSSVIYTVYVLGNKVKRLLDEYGDSTSVMARLKESFSTIELMINAVSQSQPSDGLTASSYTADEEANIGESIRMCDETFSEMIKERSGVSGDECQAPMQNPTPSGYWIENPGATTEEGLGEIDCVNMYTQPGAGAGQCTAEGQNFTFTGCVPCADYEFSNGGTCFNCTTGLAACLLGECQTGFRFEDLPDPYVGGDCVDVNECQEASPCAPQPNGTCSNTHGSYTCSCNPGWTGDGYSCPACKDLIPLDYGGECTRCSDTTTCTMGACAVGYKWVYDDANCFDIDECAEAAYPCDEHATCANQIGSYTCTCNTGWEGDGWQCTDIDECLVAYPCAPAPSATCSNNDGSHSCSCSPGYLGDGYDCPPCRDVYSVSRGGHCTLCDSDGCNQAWCPSGFAWVGADRDCINVDECQSTPCSQYATCTDTHGSFTCECLTGFQGDGFTCTDINECASADTNPCAPYPSGTCTNTLGSVTCACNPGYVGDGYTCPKCSDLIVFPTEGECDLCSSTTVCDVGICPTGFSFASNDCHDVDECASSPCSTHASCANTYGSYTCVCLTGYEGDGYQCIDINECDRYNPCDQHAKCTNEQGSYSCTCNVGYVGDGHDCPSCSSVFAAPVGFNTMLPAPLDHVAAGSCTTCSTTTQCDTAVCTTGYSFRMDSGGKWDCEDVDECSEGAICELRTDTFAPSWGTDPTSDCAHWMSSSDSWGALHGGATLLEACRSATGQAQCAHSCCEVLNANHGPCDEHATCTNAGGSYSCTCDPGWNGNGFTCTNLHECSTPSPCHQNAQCTDTDGSYTCECDQVAGKTFYYGNGWQCDSCAGVSLSNGGVCIECNSATTCDSADCPDGTLWHNGDCRKCADVVYVIGGGKCQRCPDSTTCSEASCPTGRTYSAGMCKACSSIFAASFTVGACEECTSTVCTKADCPDGYYLNNGDCRNADECVLYEPCDDNAVCTNTGGSYECTCNTGWHGDGFVCVDCNDVHLAHGTCNTCTSATVCTSATCDTGYAFSGGDCVNINECTDGLSTPCDANAICTDNDGSYTCSCQAPAYEGGAYGANSCHEVCVQPSTTGYVVTPNTASIPLSTFAPTVVCATGYAGSPAVVCNPATWSSNNAHYTLSGCSGCVNGQYADEDGLAGCKGCVAGQYGDSATTSLPSLSECQHCAPGKITPSSGYSECVDCGMGKFLLTQGGSMCDDCPAGTYMNEEGSLDVCKVCGSGQYTATVGQSECALCAAGKFQDQTEQASCADCPQGTYQNEQGRSDCKPCAVGTYASADGETTCAPCAKGTYQVAGNMHTCISCGYGTFINQAGQSDCKTCLAGTYADQTGLSNARGGSCKACSPGFYQFLSGQSECLDARAQCTDGGDGSKVNAGTGDGSCTCTPGHLGVPSWTHPPSGEDDFSNHPGWTVDCVPCNNGGPSYACDDGEYKSGAICDPAGDTDTQSCATCGNGGLTKTYTCVSDRFASGTTCDGTGDSDTQTCSLCSTVMTGCQQCNSGTECTAAHPGYFVSQTDQLSHPCNPVTGCDAAVTCTNGVNSMCAGCVEGSYLANATATPQACVTCSNGGSSYACNAGEYKSGSPCDGSGTGDTQTCTACTVCTAGTGSPAECAGDDTSDVQTPCNDCPTGKFGDGTASCADCSPGTYAGTTGLAICSECPDGQHAGSTGAAVCSECPVGKYADVSQKAAAATTACPVCAAGTYQDESGLTGCKECPDGSAAVSAGLAQCTVCVAGKFSASDGASCQACAEGTYSATPGLTECTACPAGKNGAQTGLNTADCLGGCGEGTYSDVGSPVCDGCMAGFYSDLTGVSQSSDCKSCSLGTYALEGSTECSSCPAGTYGAGYADEMATASCSGGCAAGTYSSEAGSTECQACVSYPGTDSLSLSSSACFQDEIGQASCKSSADPAQACPGPWTKTENRVCGFGGSCATDEADKFVFIGDQGTYISAVGATIEECKATCHASPDCGGFNYDRAQDVCDYRKSVSCGGEGNADIDCYEKDPPIN